MSELQRLQRVLQEVRRGWRRLAWLRIATRVAAALAVLLLAAEIAARMLSLSGTGLVAAVGMALALSGLVAGVLAWPLGRRVGDQDVARFIEDRCPECEQRLVSALDHRPSLLRPLLLRDATALAAALDRDRILPTRDRHRAAAATAIASAALALVLVVTHETTWRAARTLGFALSPWRLALSVQPGSARVAAGDSLTVVAALSGVPAGVEPPRVLLHVRSGGRDAAQAMSRARDGRYRFTIPSIRSSFNYRVVAGRAASPDYDVRALTRPRVTRVDVGYEYPTFTGLAARTEENAGDVYAPKGTRVTLRVHTNKAIRSGTFVRTDASTAQPMAPTGRAQVETEFTLEGNGAYRVALVDVDGLTSRGDTEYFLRVMDDRPPEVQIVRPAGDRTATRLEEVQIEARADDDYGVDRLELVYSVGGGRERRVKLGGGGATSLSGAHTLYLENLDVQPGDFVTYYARAVDLGKGKRPTEAQSDMFFVEIRPFAEEFVAAQSQAMAMAGGGGGADDLAVAQKDLIIATWKLERRSGAGQSVEDVRTLARAQAELRDRALRQAGLAAALGPQRAPRGEEASEPSAPSPIARAADAMARAASALNDLKTSAALPHEMEALNQLLRLDAEVQRRQIARQRGGGSGGRRTGTEDLSALFDRELLREQTTNYEQQSTVEARNERQEKSALDRIRELARRQDDLARAQAELARNRAALGDEEFKRRLERLTREQEELLQQTQQVARDMGQQQGDRRGQSSAGERQDQRQTSGGRETTDTGASADRMQRAAEEMRSAAGELQRSDPAQAAARSQRTLERLREAERAASGLPSDSRDAESRQLAEQLGAARALRDRLTALEQRLAQAERAARAGAAQEAGHAQAGSRDRGREKGQPGRQPTPGQTGESAGRPERGEPSQAGAREELARLRAEHERLQRESQQLIARALQQNPGLAGAYTTPEGHEFSRSAPGTEAFKQDFSRWDVLKQDVTDALEQLELSLAARLAERGAAGRVNAGGDERGPERYSDSLARYYEALAKKKKSGTDE